jgi:hypothetical protein
VQALLKPGRVFVREGSMEEPDPSGKKASALPKKNVGRVHLTFLLANT